MWIPTSHTVSKTLCRWHIYLWIHQDFINFTSLILFCPKMVAYSATSIHREREWFSVFSDLQHLSFFHMQICLCLLLCSLIFLHTLCLISLIIFFITFIIVIYLLCAALSSHSWRGWEDAGQATEKRKKRRRRKKRRWKIKYNTLANLPLRKIVYNCLQHYLSHSAMLFSICHRRIAITSIMCVCVFFSFLFHFNKKQKKLYIYK